jgi:hypothetical protein
MHVKGAYKVWIWKHINLHVVNMLTKISNKMGVGI